MSCHYNSSNFFVRFSYKKITVYMQSRSSYDCSMVIKQPAAENCHSDWVDVAGTNRYSLATIDFQK